MNIALMPKDAVIKSLEHELKARGWNWKEFGQAIGVSPQTIVNWKNRGIPPRSVPAVADLFGWDVEALMKGVIAKKTGKEIVIVPQLDVEGSAGGGRATPEHEEVINNITISRRWAADNLSVTNPANLRLITAYGDSMQPTFADGDVLVVDTGITDVKVDSVYVMEREGELFIKRLERKIDGSLVVRSDNRAVHDPYEISRNDLARVRICGRVVYVWNGKKL